MALLVPPIYSAMLKDTETEGNRHREEEKLFRDIMKKIQNQKRSVSKKVK